jgi:hypothetical protein
MRACAFCAQQAAGSPHGSLEMIRLTLTKHRLFDLTLDHASARSNAGSNRYRFGRISGKSVRFYAHRAAMGAKALAGGMLRIITAAKLRRIEREFRIHGPNHDWLRIDDDHFTQVDR